jgi:hypothetical protein
MAGHAARMTAFKISVRELEVDISLGPHRVSTRSVILCAPFLIC